MDNKNQPRHSGYEPNGQDSLRLIPKNWVHFQHYKDRCPPWIKLHRDILNDRQFMCLPIASKALAPLLWLLASESKDGIFDASIEELEFRLRIPSDQITTGLKALLDKGFFLDARTMLAACLQDAIPETETERETETEQRQNMSKKNVFVEADFENFWETYNLKVGKHKAKKIWLSINPDEELTQKIIAGAKLYADSNAGSAYYKHPSTWLNNHHWEDDPQAVKPKIATQSQNMTAAQATKLAAARTIFGDERNLHGTGKIIDVTPNAPAAGLLGAENI